MSAVNLPEDFLLRLKRLEDQVRTLSRAPRLQSSSIEDGSLAIRDASGKIRLRVGKQSDGAYVGRAWDSSGEGVNSPLWDTGFNHLRVIDSGVTSVPFPASGGTQEATTLVTHSLGFRPIALAFVEGTTGQWRPLSWTNEFQSGADEGKIGEHIDLRITSTQLVAERFRHSAIGSGNAFDVFWFILREQVD